MLGTSKSVWGFDPRTVPGCQLWLDGADSSSMTLSGSSVTQWRDKSGSSNHFTPTSGTPTSILDNGRSVVNFTSGAIMRSANQITFTTSSAFFIVSRLNLVNASNTGMLLDFTFWNGYKSIRFFGPNGILGGTPATYGDEYELANGAYYVNGTFNPSFTGSTYLNTYSLIGTVAPQSGGTSYLAFSSSFYERYFIGNIAEFLYYPGGVTSSQRQQVEGYLAHKWGLSLSIPSTHPFYSLRPHLRGFQPNDIDGCQLWLDAADQSSLVLSGSSVTTWINKGSVVTTAIPTRGATANQITYVTVDSYPGVYINNNNLAVYNSSTYSQLTIQSNFQTTRDYSVFAVVNLLNSSNGAEYQTIYTNERASGAESRSPNFGAGITFEYISDGTNRSINSSFIGTGRLQTSLTSSTSALTAYKNGTVYASNTSSLTGTSSDSGALPMIGGTYGAAYGNNAANSDNRFATGYFHELLVFSTALTTSQRQQVEGYIAHKWGLTTPIPSTHPFKSILPASLYFEPATKYSALFNNTSLVIPSSSSVTLGTNNHTIEFWAYQTSRGQYDCPFQYSINTSAFSTSSYYMALGGYLGVLIGNNAGNFAINMGATVSLPSLNRWHHYAIVRNGTTFTIYINGISRETATSSVNIGAQTGSFLIGDVSTSTTTPFFGYITNFRLVNGTAVYTSNFIPSTSPLTAIPNTQILLQGLTDRSANAFTVTNNRGVTLSTVSPFPPP